MYFRWFIRVLLLALCWAGLKTYGQGENQTWIFEGTVTYVDAVLEPDLQKGWVLSGSFSLNRLEMESEPVEAGEDAGRMGGGIRQAELSIDLYHRVQFAARQVPGLAGLDFHNDAVDADGRDLVAWFFPVKGQLAEKEWVSRWLQIWLTDPSGKMLDQVPPVISPYGLEWENAWFRLTFEDDKGNLAYVDGQMDVFCPESEEDGESRWRGIAAELIEELLARDETILSLREELAVAKSREEGLRQMVDLLIQERTGLQDEISRLEAQAVLADPAFREQIDQLMADKALMVIEIEDLDDRNRALAESLARSEQSRIELLSRLDDVKVGIRGSESDRDWGTDLDSDSDSETGPSEFSRSWLKKREQRKFR